MKKLRLALDQLEVDSFSTWEELEERGTVHGFYSVDNSTCCSLTFICDDATCGRTVWEAGCGTATSPADCSPTEGGYAWCQSLWCETITCSEI